MSIYEPNEKAFDKRTLLAVVLMVVVVTVGMSVQSILFPKKPLAVQTEQPAAAQPGVVPAPAGATAPVELAAPATGPMALTDETAPIAE
ncbi:MAG TPA: hypothetical protein PLC54_07955, partial [Spirochaetales bacterium]|nr:hypothetical protein [Spirochaetales bacterium]